MREFVFKTSSATNLLCRWTRAQPDRWILIQLLRGSTREKANAAVFTLRGPTEDIDRFLKEDFGRKYGTFDIHRQEPGLASVEVTNYLLPAYRGADPVELAVKLLGQDAFFDPILVHDGYIHIKVVAAPPPADRGFPELLKRLSAATHPEDFQLIHTGGWDPLRRLKPRDDALTSRQSDVLRAAVEFGYYDEPRRCTLEEIAKAFGVSKAAIHKQLVAGESKIIKNAVT